MVVDELHKLQGQLQFQEDLFNEKERNFIEKNKSLEFELEKKIRSYQQNIKALE